MTEKRTIHAVVLAGGAGTRFRSEHPKVLHPILGKMMLAYSVEASLAAGAGQVTVVVSPGIHGAVAEAVGQSYDTNRVHLAIQPNANGTGGAVQAAMSTIATNAPSTILVVCGDTPLLRGSVLDELLQHHAWHNASATVLAATLPDPARYGRVLRDPVRIVEAKDATPEELQCQEVNTGVWAFETEWLVRHLPKLTTNNAQNELYLTDLLQLAADQNAAEIYATTDHHSCYGINDRTERRQAETILQERLLQQLENSGTSLCGTGHYIEEHVRCGRDTVVESHVSLKGRVSIGQRCVIGTGSVLKDVTIGDDVVIEPYSVLESASVAAQCHIGPFARIRPGTEIHDGAKIGNFVETKNTVVHKGAKVNHLTYVGDAIVGASANIGAGTITCNYDGVNKYKTVIGERAFVGSNSSLVAPVEIGSGAIVGAGSVVTKSVPDEALYVERSEPRIVQEYARRRKKAKSGSS